MRKNDQAPNVGRGGHKRGGRGKQIGRNNTEMTVEGSPIKKDANEEEWKMVTQNNHSQNGTAGYTNQKD